MISRLSNPNTNRSHNIKRNTDPDPEHLIWSTPNPEFWQSKHSQKNDTKCSILQCNC